MSKRMSDEEAARMLARSDRVAFVADWSAILLIFFIFSAVIWWVMPTGDDPKAKGLDRECAADVDVSKEAEDDR